MSTLVNLLRLSLGEAAALSRVSVLLILAEASLRIWSFRTILGALEKRAGAASGGGPGSEAWADLTQRVELADRHGLFRPSCLRRALVVAWVLSGRGIPSNLKIGVTKDRGNLSAHAWVEITHPEPLRLLGEPGFVDLVPRTGSPERA